MAPRSAYAIATVSATPPMIDSTFQTHEEDRLPRDTSITVTTSTAIFPKGADAGSRGPRTLATTWKATSKANAPEIGSMAQNAPRQYPACAKTPPIAGPASVATPHILDTSTMARDHSRSSKSSRTQE